MKRTRIAAVLVTLALAAPAWAQDVEVTKDDGEDGSASADSITTPEITARPTFMEGGGVKLTDGIYFHPSASLETVYQTNVFADSESSVGAPLMRVGVSAALGTEAEGGGPPAPDSGVKMILSSLLDLTWNQYLSSNDNVMSQTALGIGLVAHAKFNPGGTWVWELHEGYTRAIRPPPSETSQSLNRDLDQTSIALTFKPGGGAIQGTLSYTFGFDLFEQSAVAANRWSQTIQLAGKWQWLPRTQFQLDASLGFLSNSASSVKPGGSMPLRVLGGTSTLISPTVGVLLKVGYGNSFSDAGDSFSSYLALAEVRWAIAPTIRVAAGYQHDFTDSIIGNYFSDHSFYARWSMLLGGQWQVRARADARVRSYSGVINPVGGDVLFCPGAAGAACPRSDFVGSVEGAVDYQLNPWLVLGASWHLETDTTSFSIRNNSDGRISPAGYVWNELLVRAVAKF